MKNETTEFETSRKMSATTRQVLEALREHPFLTAQQLSWHIQRHHAVVQRQLWQLQRKRWVRRYPFYGKETAKAQWLYTLTPCGLEKLASAANLSQSGYQQKYGYSISRLRWLALGLDRVYHVRQVLMHIETICQGWSVRSWNVETETRYAIRSGQRWLTYHASATLVKGGKRWLPLVIEWDTDLVPVEGELARWMHFVSAQGDPEFEYSIEYRFPVLLVIAQDFQRLKNLHDLLRKIATRVRMPIPRAYYLTDYRQWITNLRRPQQSHDKLWYCVEKGEWVEQPFVECEGNSGDPQRFWQRRPYRMSFAGQTIQVKPLPMSARVKPTLDSLASLSLALRPLEKRIVSTVARYPLLTAAQLGIVLQASPSKVWDGLARLVKWQLIRAQPFRIEKQQAKPAHQVQYYILTDLGVRYLAAAAGFGNAPKRFAKARGWEKSLEGLVKHIRHTRIENTLFIQLLNHARAHGHYLTWYSEQEARLYINISGAEWAPRFSRGRPTNVKKRGSSARVAEMDSEQECEVIDAYPTRKQFYRRLALHGQHLLKYLPDGRGIYEAGSKTWQIAVEIDLSRANYDKWRAKLDYYYRYILFTEEEPNLRILIVTHNWTRAENLYWVVWKFAALKVRIAELCQADTTSEQLADWERGVRTMERLWASEKHTPQSLIKEVLPVYITTVDELERRGIEEPIWLRVQERMGEDGKIQHTHTQTKCMEYIE